MLGRYASLAPLSILDPSLEMSTSFECVKIGSSAAQGVNIIVNIKVLRLCGDFKHVFMGSQYVVDG